LINEKINYNLFYDKIGLKKVGISEKIIDLSSPRYIPIEIFTNELGIFETLVKYMKDNFDISFTEIGNLVNRSPKTIWEICRKNKKNHIKKQKKSILLIPAVIFSNRNFSPLESLTFFLKDKGLRNRDIAYLLKRNERNIWTVYNRALKKRGDAS